jgi:hypothetical protein
MQRNRTERDVSSFYIIPAYTCVLHTTYVEGGLKETNPKETSPGPVTQESRKH